MSIASISTSSNSANSPFGDYSVIKLLEKQKMQLQEQIQKVNESKMDPKMKQEKIDGLTEQITQIEAQIQQKRTEQIKPDYDKADSQSNKNEDDKTQDESYGGSIDSKHMISAVVGYSDLKTMGKVRTQLKNELRMATHSGESPEAGIGIQEKIDELEGDMQKKSEKINKDLKKASKEVQKTQKREKQETAEEVHNDPKGTSKDIEKADTDNPIASAGDKEPDQAWDKGMSSDDGNSAGKGKVTRKGKESVPVQGKSVDMRI